MKKNRIFGLSAAISLLMAGACSEETLNPGADQGLGNISPEDGVYMTVNFEKPSLGGTRSFTQGPNASNNGTEIGSDAENKVGDIAIVLARTSDNAYIASALVPSDSVMQVGTTGTTFKATSKFSKTSIAAYYNTEGYMTQNQLVNVFVFCNPTNTLNTTLTNAELGNQTWYNEIGSFTEGATGAEIIWADNQFLMANNSIATRQFPANLADWDNYSTEASPFNLSGVNSFGRPNEIDNWNNNRGNVRVERACARFDFRDGSVDGLTNEALNGFGNQSYHVVLDQGGTPLVDVKLGKMSFVNMNQQYYFLRRVSPTGMPTNTTLCGAELPWYSNATGTELEGDGNYVVDAQAAWKNVTTLPSSGFSSVFNYPFFNEDGEIDNLDAALGSDRWYTSLISTVLSSDKNDNTDSWNEAGTYQRYKVWRYATENTIPGVNTQKNAVSTGVVFKGQMIAAREATDDDDQGTKDLLNALKIEKDLPAGETALEQPILYVFAGHVYCHWKNVRDAALSLAISNIKWEGTGDPNSADGKWVYTINRSSSLYNAVFGTGGFGTVSFTYTEKDKDGNVVKVDVENITDDVAIDPNCANQKYLAWETDKTDNALFEAFQTAVIDKKFTIYQRSEDPDLGGWGYYCYYYYWNRHNDNGQNGVMGPMEFAVVRNNVYKLAVTKIARLGHPRNSKNDPDKPTPNTPDEKSDIYLTVSCTTLPWVVRVNDIEF